MSSATFAAAAPLMNDSTASSGAVDADVAATETPTPAGAGPLRQRLVSIDNLQVLLTVLVVMVHAAVTYGDIPVWYYTEPAKDRSGVVLDLLVVLAQTFLMGELSDPRPWANLSHP
jgi:hypothetical protein